MSKSASHGNKSGRVSGAKGGAVSVPRFDVKTLTHLDRIEDTALYLAGVASLVMFVLTIFFSWGHESVPVVGSLQSVSAYTMLAAILIALIIAPFAYIRGAQWRNSRATELAESNWRWRVFPVTVGAVLVNVLVVVFTFLVVNAAFPQVHISGWAAPPTMAVLTGALAYYVARNFYFVRASGLLLIVVISLMGTLMFAGALNDDPLWYEGSFSGLGMTESNSRIVFNVGLIITGLLIIAWSQFLLDDIAILVKRGVVQEKHVRQMRTLFALAGILLGMVGVVRWGIGPLGNLLHDIFAGGAGAALGAILVGMYWFIPHFVKWFYYFSWGLLALIVLAVILKIMGLFSLTGIELYGFGAACLWLLIFMRSVINLILRVEPSSFDVLVGEARA